MTDAPASDEYDTVTSDHETIRSRIEEWGGAPALTRSQHDGSEPVIVFEESGENAEIVSWDEFFEHLDSESVALAYRTDDDGAATPPAYEFVRRPDREQDGSADASSEQTVARRFASARRRNRKTPTITETANRSRVDGSDGSQPLGPLGPVLPCPDSHPADAGRRAAACRCLPQPAMTATNATSLLKNLSIVSTIADAAIAFTRGDRKGAALLFGAAALSKRIPGLGTATSVLLRAVRRFK